MKSYTTWRFKQGRMTLSTIFDCKSIMKKRNFMNLLAWEEFVEFSGVEDYEKMEYLTSTWPVPKETKTRITNYLERLKSQIFKGIHKLFFKSMLKLKIPVLLVHWWEPEWIAHTLYFKINRYVYLTFGAEKKLWSRLG